MDIKEIKKPPVLTDAEVDTIIEKGINFDHKPTSEGEIHRQIQRDADVKFYREALK